MINEENLNKIYEGVVSNQELTTKVLNNYGFNSKDIANLIEKDLIERVKRGYYAFKSVDDLYSYGKELISKKRYNAATLCFQKCYELAPNNHEICNQLFFRCIQVKNYEQAIQYLEVIHNSQNEHYKVDSNFYLYLLNLVTKLPEKYEENVKNLKLKDIKVNTQDKRYRNVSAQNMVRLFSFKQRFRYALKQLKDLREPNEKLDFQSIIINTLLGQVVGEQETSNEIVIKFIQEEKYEEIIKYLELLQERRNLSHYEEYTLILAQNLLNIIETSEIPNIDVPTTKKLKRAIYGKNYKLAFRLSIDYINESDLDMNNNAVYVLLEKICNLY